MDKLQASIDLSPCPLLAKERGQGEVNILCDMLKYPYGQRN
jgi:hypothetical protein